MDEQMTMAKIQGVNPETYLQEVELLLKAKGQFQGRKWAIAISALTGRRFAEIIARGSFRKTEHPFLLRFEGVPKRDGIEFEVLTLLPAHQVLRGINRLRREDEIKELMALQGEDRDREINLFNGQLNRVCNKALGPVVPLLVGRKTVVVRDLRSLWGTLALWKFCSVEQDLFATQYLVPVLGPKAVEEGGPFQLVDGEGQPLAQGWESQDQIPAFPLIEIEEDAPEEVSELTEEPPIESASEQGADLRQELSQLVDDKLEALRSEFVQQLLGLRDQMLGQVPKQAEPEKTADLSGLVRRLGELEQENQVLVTDCERLRAEAEQVAATQQAMQVLEQENLTLKTQLQEVQAKLNQFKVLLLGEGTVEETPPEEEPLGAEVTDSDNEPVAAVKSAIEQVADTLPHKQSRKRGKAKERAMRIFEALQVWNEQHPDETLVLNRGLLETVFRIHRQAARGFCEEFAEQIDAHHQTLEVSNFHSHNRGKDFEGFKAFVEQFNAV